MKSHRVSSHSPASAVAAIQIIDEDHLTPFHLYGGGDREFSADQFRTDYVGIGLRIGTDGTAEDIAEINENLTPTMSIEGAKDEDSMPRPDRDTMLTIRAAMIEQYAMMTNENNIVSSTRGAILEPNGSFAVVFGGEECREKAPNWAYTPEDGWSFLLRAYRPRVEEFKAYEMPELQRVE